MVYAGRITEACGSGCSKLVIPGANQNKVCEASLRNVTVNVFFESIYPSGRSNMYALSKIFMSRTKKIYRLCKANICHLESIVEVV